MTAEDWRKQLGLEAHPEGGWFRRIYTADAPVETAQGTRPLATSIHYLLDREQPTSRFHRVRSTILHFLQSGGPVKYAVLTADGQLEEVTLGLAAGQRIALEVDGGRWKASRLTGEATHALVSEVVMPGFDWRDHEYLRAGTLSSELRATLSARGWSVA